MKQCPICRTTYNDEMNYCLNDGSRLENTNTDYDKMSDAQTIGFEKNKVPTEPNQIRPTAVSLFPRSKKSNTGKVLFIVAFVGLMFFGGLVYGLVSMIAEKNWNNKKQVYKPPSSAAPSNTPDVETNRSDGKLKVEISDRVKDNFGDSYLKCLITNTGDAVIVDPSFSLDLYNNDVKTGTLRGTAQLDYLKPGQTIPVWISLFGEKKFTSARYDETENLQVSDKDPEKLFPTLVFTNAKLSVETATSSYNGRLYQDKIFVVSGIVENQTYENISPDLFILYYDDKNEIVGINSTYPSSMKKGEKSTFESSIGKTSSFGTPGRFEIIAVNDR